MPRPASPPSRRRSRWQVLRPLSAALVGTGVAVGVLGWASNVLSASGSTARVQPQLTAWSSGRTPWSVEAWTEAEQRVLAAQKRVPGNAEWHGLLVQLYALQGLNAWTTGATSSEEVAWLRMAMDQQQAMLRLRPGHAASWAELAMLQSAVGEPAEKWLPHWRKALALGPRELGVQQTLAHVAVSHWADLPDDLRTWLTQYEPGVGARLEREAAQRLQAEAQAREAEVAAAAASAAAAKRRAAIDAAAARARAAGY
jgi:hypothetical protein